MLPEQWHTPRGEHILDALLFQTIFLECDDVGKIESPSLYLSMGLQSFVGL
jgi:hypothetical protein